ncbi:MAG: homocysteine S-methyltransferase family protein [Patescibacteria group bacterium]
MTFKKNKTYTLAGATGTEIQRRGFSTVLPLWSAGVLFERPDLLTDIYQDYIRAGADIITTNTFRTQRRTLAKARRAHETERINRLAVDLAVTAREQEVGNARHVLIAGCMTTLEDCYRPDLVPPPDTCAREHGEQARLLAETPIDLFLLETFNTIGEARITAAAVRSTGKPFMISFTARDDGAILDGSVWADAVAVLKEFSPLAILVNCVPPSVATRALTLLAPYARTANIPFGVYANGEGKAGGDEGWDFSLAGSPIDAYATSCRGWKQMGASIIGGCCGTTPEYTARYARL